MDLLELTLSNETLDNLIQTSNSLENLKSLLQIKYRRLGEGQCEKLIFSTDSIYNNNVAIELGARILKSTLFVARDVEIHLTLVKKFCFDNFICDSNGMEYSLHLFNVVCEYYSNENREIGLEENDSKQFHDAILITLKGSSKPLVTFILLDLLPNYLNACNQMNSDLLLTEIFKLIKETKKLEVLCLCYDLFFSRDGFNLMGTDDFWLLLIDCILGPHYLQKQAIYLLSKSVEIVLKKRPSRVSSYVKVNHHEAEVVWQNYLCLLDVSNEKQLHIIEPSLPLFSSIQKLHIDWRRCLYKVFLNHSQNSVVYYVASFILQNETEWSNFSQISKVLLFSINKNEYNEEAKKIFKEIALLCERLSQNQFDIFLEDSINVPWIPAAIWMFYNNIFNDYTSFLISLPLLENILTRLKLIPHRFIRDGCTNIVLNYFIKSYVIGSLKDLLKVSLLLWNFNQSLFNNFVGNNQERILKFCDEIFFKTMSDDSLAHIEIKLNILQMLKTEMNRIPKFETYSNKSDLINLFFNDSEKYIINRIESIRETDDITYLLSLIKKTDKIIILEGNSAKYNDMQKVVAFFLVNSKGNGNSKALLDFWKFRTTNDPQITKLFVELLRTCDLQLGEIEEAIFIMGNILDSQSPASVTILENISCFFKQIDQKIVLEFLERCFDEFLNLNKSGVFKITARIFLSQIFQPHLFVNEEFSQKVFRFSEKLLNLANSANSIACILSEKIARLVEHSPASGFVFIPLITDLILYGIVVNKTERVEYHVCQEIGMKLSARENNPNFEEVSVRLLALESIISLVGKDLPNAEDAINSIVTLLLEKYMKYFSKRYFPHSQIHLEKLRILQTLLLLENHLKSKTAELIEFIIESFVLESHQPSVKHLMQLLLLRLLINAKGTEAFFNRLNETLQTIDNNRPSTVSGFIPVLYHLVDQRDESQWHRIVQVLLPYAMGAQFKLRIFSQVAVLKLYEKAVKIGLSSFVDKYKFLYDSLKNVVEATENALCDVSSIHHEFLDYFSLKNCDCSTILYTIPKENGVTAIEWENLSAVYSHKHLRHLRFTHSDVKKIDKNESRNQIALNRNIQKKFTPWKEMLENNVSTNDFILVTSLIEKATNLGGLSRTCEVFGIKQMVMRTSKITADKEFKSLSMSSENWVDIADVKVEDLQNFILKVKKQGYVAIGAEQTAESVKLNQFQFPKKTVLLMGNEKEGISAELIPLLDKCIEIPQFGMVRSLNVHVAGAIVMWEYCKQHKL